MHSTRRYLRRCPAIALLVAASLPSHASAPNPLELRPHHITASVADLDRATAWYQQILGFTVRERGHHGPVAYVELSIPGFGVALIMDPAIKASPSPNPYGWLHIVFTVADPNAAYEVLQHKGAKPKTRDDPQSGLVHSFLVQDSEGNEIEIVGDALP